MKRRTKIIVALLVLAGVAAVPLLPHLLLKRKVAQYRRELAAQGEKMSIRELEPLMPDDRENGARRLTAAVALALDLPWTNQPRAMHLLAPGRAMVAWEQAVLPSENNTNLWPGLRRDIQAKHEALAEMRAALKMPRLAFQNDYSQGFNMLLPHLSQLKYSAQWLSGAAILDLHEGRMTNAVENLEALTALTAHYQDEPLMISVYGRFAIGAISFQTTWEALQSPDWTDDQLARLQAEWEAMEFFHQAEAAISMDRVMIGRFYQDCRSSRQYMMGTGNMGSSSSVLMELRELGAEIREDPIGGWKNLMNRFPAYWAWCWWWSYTDELTDMQLFQAALTALREARREKCFGPALKQYDVDCRRFWEHRIRSDFYMGFGGEARSFLVHLRGIELQRRLLVTALALKRYQLRHGQFPTDLAALVPAICPEIPRDPMDGQPLRYRPQTDGSFLLYSVGEDGVDDNGDPSPGQPYPRNWLKGRDVVWPQAALPGEAVLYRLPLEAQQNQDRVGPRVIVTNDMSPAVIAALERVAKVVHLQFTNAPGPQP